MGIAVTPRVAAGVPAVTKQANQVGTPNPSVWELLMPKGRLASSFSRFFQRQPTAQHAEGIHQHSVKEEKGSPQADI